MSVAGVRGFWETAKADPGRAAIISAGGVVTYGELGERVDRIASGLLAHGSGGTVAVLLPNVPEILAVQFAAAQVGWYFTPINRHLTGPEVSYVLSDSQADVFVAHERFAEVAAAAAAEVGLPAERRLAVGDIGGFRDLAAFEAEQPAGPPAKRTGGTLMLYSSGTTGRPKGIRRALPDGDPEAAILPSITTRAGLFGWVPDDGVHLAMAPLYHSAPNLGTLSSLHLGHTIVLEERFDPVRAMELIERHRVTHTFMVPTMFHRLLTLPAVDRRRFDLGSIRQVVHAGAPCPVDTKHGMIDWIGPVLYEYYGATETGIATFNDSHQWLSHPGSVGPVIEGFDIKIRDAEGNDLPPGAEGEIWIKGGYRFAYHNDPAKTESSWRGEYFAPGDVGYLSEDGWLYLCDRRTDMILSGGVNVYPAEIEGELLQHPSVADAVVIGVPDPEWGNRVVALVQPADGVAGERTDLASALEDHCRERLAGYKCPREYAFRTELPRTPTGKINRGRVRDSYLAALPGR